MMAFDAWIGLLMTGIVRPAGSVATDPWVLLSVAAACLMVRTRAAYIFSAVVGTFVFVVTHSALYTSGQLTQTQLVSWIVAPVLAALVITFAVRTVLRLIKAQGAGA